MFFFEPHAHRLSSSPSNPVDLAKHLQPLLQAVAPAFPRPGLCVAILVPDPGGDLSKPFAQPSFEAGIGCRPRKYKYRKIRKVVKSTPCCNADSQASAADWDSCFCRLSTSLARPWRSWAKSSVLKRFVLKSTLQGHTTQSKSENPQEKVIKS